MIEYTIPKRQFLENLADAMAWCMRSALQQTIQNIRMRKVLYSSELLESKNWKTTPLSSVYRSDELDAFAQRMFPYDGSGYSQTPRSDSFVFDAFVAERRRLLNNKVLDSQIVEEELARQHSLLLFDACATITDGATRAGTAGYFDAADNPPWDTWVFISRESKSRTLQHPYVLAWVPPWAEEIVQNALVVDCVECLYWARVMPNGVLELKSEQDRFPLRTDAPQIKLF